MLKFTKILKRIFWKLPLLPSRIKEKMRMKYAEKKFSKENSEEEFACTENEKELLRFSHYILEQPTIKYEGKKAYKKHVKNNQTAILIAYYLTQYSPDIHNDEWWGKGTTEWNNVSQAVPQFVGHRQPRLPGELGFYDLRIKDVMRRQIEIAKNYGIDVFSFYYYWFAGERILEKPLDMFLEDKTLNMPFIFCWANENWTRRFSGTDESVLIGMENTVENYQAFIREIIPYLTDERYFKLDGKPVLQIYRPELIPSVQEVLGYWRKETKEKTGLDLYILACQSQDISINWVKKGFDAENEWMQGSIRMKCKDITQEMRPIRKDFVGEIIDYADMVRGKKYVLSANRKRKVYPAVMPMWDNSARRNNKGIIWQGSTPQLYKEWLSDIISEVRLREELEAPIVFINAWNEWGEGAYLEPDRDYGYAYLQATWEAKQETEG